MNSLIITAHPNAQGFTHKIAKRYIEGLQAKWVNYELINLYTTPLTQGFLQLNEKNKPLDDPHKITFQKQITWADEIVFIWPMRWWDLPAIIKNFFEVNFSGGFAFKYTSTWAEKLLLGKKARVYMTAGGPNLLYTFLLPLYWILWWAIRLEYCGLRLTKLRIFGGFGSATTEQQKNTILQKIFDDSQS